MKKGLALIRNENYRENPESMMPEARAEGFKLTWGKIKSKKDFSHENENVKVRSLSDSPHVKTEA